MEKILRAKIESDISEIITNRKLSIEKQAQLLYKMFNVDIGIVEKYVKHKIVEKPKDTKELEDMIIAYNQASNYERYGWFDKYINTLINYKIIKLF